MLPEPKEALSHMPSKKKADTSKRKKWPTRPKEPVVFMFQPTEYEVVPPERHSEWERLMRTEVGFPAEAGKALSQQARLSVTLSFRNGEFVD
jgi:hypothetical protein